MPPKGKSRKTLQRVGEEGVSPGVGGGYSDTSINTKARAIFRGSNFEYQYFFFRKMNVFGGLGYDETGETFRKPLQNGLFWGDISNHSWAFS